MKKLLGSLFFCSVLAVMGSNAFAMMVVNEVKKEGPLNTVITGEFGGYRPGEIFIVHPDGVRESYPMDISEGNMKRVTRMHLKTRVRFTIIDGKVVHVEKVSR